MWNGAFLGGWMEVKHWEKGGNHLRKNRGGRGVPERKKFKYHPVQSRCKVHVKARQGGGVRASPCENPTVSKTGSGGRSGDSFCSKTEGRKRRFWGGKKRGSSNRR